MNKKKMNFRDNMKQLTPFIAPYKWSFLLAIAMVVVTCVALAIAPKIEGNITSQLAADVVAISKGVAGARIQYDIVLKFICFLFGIYLLKTIAQVISIIYLTNAIQNAMHDLRNALQDKIRRLPVRYFDNHQFGDVLSRITNDVDAVSNALQQSFTQIINGILMVCLSVSMMLTINVWMTCIALCIIPLSLLITRFMVKRSQKRFRAQQDALGELNGTITELYGGFNEILLYNKQTDSIEKFKVINDKLQHNAFKAQFMSSMISPCIGLVTYLTIGTIAVVGSMFAIQGVIQVGSLQAFIRYIWQINDPLSQVSNLSAQIQSAFAAMGRIFAILREEEELVDVENPKHISDVKGNVVFDHVKFGYYDQEIIHDLDVEVTAGQMIAIVGPTGAGKTTIINLLMRFYDVKGGSIRIDGVDIRDMKREELRQIFAMVLQDTWLFSGSIYENLRYGRLSARKDEVIEAAKMANVHHFIRTLPDGYNMMINEEGSNISQGEKQLLTIARAFLKDSQILILDEATSSVDNRLERMLQDAMQRVMVGRTSFVIAHRLSTIRNADLILVMENGNIVEQGNHEQLMSKQGAYEKLYNSQFAHLQN